MASPVNASRLDSRVTAHHSGPRQLAKPYLVGDFHLLAFASLSWRTPVWVDYSLSMQTFEDCYQEFRGICDNRPSIWSPEGEISTLIGRWKILKAFCRERRKERKENPVSFCRYHLSKLTTSFLLNYLWLVFALMLNNTKTNLY